MTLDEAIDSNITKVRLPYWDPKFYLRIKFMENGFVEPFLSVYEDSDIVKEEFIEDIATFDDFEEYKS